MFLWYFSWSIWITLWELIKLFGSFGTWIEEHHTFGFVRRFFDNLKLICFENLVFDCNSTFKWCLQLCNINPQFFWVLIEVWWGFLEPSLIFPWIYLVLSFGRVIGWVGFGGESFSWKDWYPCSYTCLPVKLLVLSVRCRTVATSCQSLRVSRDSMFSYSDQMLLCDDSF